MENKKKTAVEFLELQLIKNSIITNNDLKKAKEIEKQQKMDAWNDGNCNTDLKGNPSANYAISAEQYYNEQYGS